MPTHRGTQTIETQRLTLRRATIADAQAMFDHWASDPEVTKYLMWPAHISLDITRQVLQSWVNGYQQDNFYQWLVVPKDLGQPIGSISGMNPNDQLSSVEVAYCIGRPWWHQGLTTEALHGVLGYLFDTCDFHRITAKHDTRNPHSGGVMQKCSMTCEGTSRQSDCNNQGICDTVHYAILKQDWNRPKCFDNALHFENDTQLVQELYRRLDENSRLNHSQAARVEFLTTVHYIEQYLTPRAKILDVGAGAGEYSLYFARQGYQVSALELSEANIAAFRSKLTPQDTVDLVQGNALDLSRYPDNSFDIVLLFGPLYHLHSHADQLRCIHEAKRVCKPDGKLFFAFIANDMVILTMFHEVPDYFVTGDYNKETFRCDDFPFVFHTVDACRALLREGGVKVLHEVASDGVSELLQEKINAMDKENYAQYLRYHFYTCEKPEHLGASNHLLFVGQVETVRHLWYHGANSVENGVYFMDRELLQTLQSCYARLETKAAQLSQALRGIVPLESGWYNGHYHRGEDGTWVRESYPIPVLEVKHLCDIEVHIDRISLSTKLRRAAALDYSFTPVAEYPFEVYGVEDYLADFYHPGQTIQGLKENLCACKEEEIGFSFTLPFEADGAQVLDLVQLLRREGFYS